MRTKAMVIEYATNAYGLLVGLACLIYGLFPMVGEMIAARVARLGRT